MESPVVFPRATSAMGCGQKRIRHNTPTNGAAPTEASLYHSPYHFDRHHDLFTNHHDNDDNDTHDDDYDDASIAAMHAMKRLKVNDDDGGIVGEEPLPHTVCSNNSKDDDNDDDEEEDDKSSITSVSSLDSPVPDPPTRPVHAALTLEDYPLTPKLNNRSSRRGFLRSSCHAEDTNYHHHHHQRSLSDNALADIQVPPMNAYLGRLHHEQRGLVPRPSNLVNGMDALSILDVSTMQEAAPSDLLLPMLGTSPTSSPTAAPSYGGRWKVQLRTDSKLE